jgi:hypothetical protein
MKSLHLCLILIAISALLVVAAPLTTRSTSATALVAVENLSPATNRELARARSATAKYHDVARAVADGYVLQECVEGEGFEYLKFSLVDCTFDVEHPEALHYISQGNHLRLAGVEYVIPIVCTPTAPPAGFSGNDDVWTFMAEGLPIWALNAAIWLPNPNGMFARDNPRVPPCP